MKHYEKLKDLKNFLLELPYNFDIPVACTNGQDPIETLHNTFKLFLLKKDFIDINKYWFPFLIYENKLNNMYIFYLCMDKKIKIKKKIKYETIYLDCNNDDGYKKYIDYYHDKLVIANRILEYSNREIFEALHQISIIYEDQNIIKLQYNKNSYIIDLINFNIIYNNWIVIKQNKYSDHIYII
jgi:hypothetical protein